MTGDADDELLRLVSRALNDELPPEELARLEAILHDDPSARRQYYELVKLHGHLSWTFGKVGGRESAEKAAATKAPASPVLGFLGGVVDSAIHSRTFLLLALCAVLGLAAVVRFATPLFRGAGPNGAQIANGDGPKAGAGNDQRSSPDEPLKVVARLTNAVDCQWKIAGSASPQDSAFKIGSQLIAGQKLDLVAGYAELTFESGAKVILHGPAQFALTDALGGSLDRGMLVAKVPHDSTIARAAAFAIKTPAGKVVDLGTEFGVKVGDDGAMRVVVYVGAVEVDSQRGVDGQPNTMRLTAGQGAVAASDRPIQMLAAAEISKLGFVRDLASLVPPRERPDAGDRAQKDAAYVALVKKLKPVVWFRMEGRDGDTVLHDEVDGADAQLSWKGPGSPFIDGHVGGALWLRGKAFKDHAIVPDYPKAAHSKLSVAAWVYAEGRPNFASIAKNWRYSNDGMGQFHFGLVSEFNPKKMDNRTASVDLGVEVAGADGKAALVREGVEHPFPTYEWQHVAFVADGETVRLYRQGREVASAQVIGVRFPVEVQALGIGIKTNKHGTAPDAAFPGYWQGRIDELAIFNEALTAEQVRQLATGP